MRVSVLLGQTAKGDWLPLALPDKDIEEQKGMFKKAILSNGSVKVGKNTVQLSGIIRFDQYAKRARFHAKPVVETPVEPVA